MGTSRSDAEVLGEARTGTTVDDDDLLVYGNHPGVRVDSVQQARTPHPGGAAGTM